MLNLFGSWSLSLSPLARRGFRCLLPLFVLAIGAVGLTVATSLYFRDAGRERLATARAAYEAARRSQVLQHASRKSQEELAALWKQLPARREFPELVLKVSEVAHQDHVVIPGITYVFDNVDGGLAVKASMTFRSVGEYGAIRRFIDRLETTGPYLFIESLDARRSIDAKETTRAGKTGSVTPVVFNFRVVTFLRPHTDDAKGAT
jgi:Tfp pilus assembly protein PilO